MARKKTRKYVGQRSVDLMKLMPVDQDQLHRFVHKVLGMDVPRKPMVDGHAAPFDYLKHVFLKGKKVSPSTGGPRKMRLQKEQRPVKRQTGQRL
ncbi:MAG: hypothetical protein HC898_03595 [Phycisphaerales bacterium]|nr:hypothetical protein [Phycisphaerales bacterium]